MDTTTRPIPTTLRGHLKATVRLAGPLAMAQLATFLMGMVDTACVGRYSEEALGAVGVGNALHWAFSCLVLGIPFAMDPLISQSLGGGEKEKAYRWFIRGLQAVVFVAVPVIALELWAASNLALFGLSPELVESAWNYLVYRAPALLFFHFFLTGRAYLQAHEITRPILMAAIVANVVNLVLDVLLIFGDRTLEAIGLPAIGLPALGETGAGITTTASTVSLCIYVLWQVHKIRPSMDGAAPNRTRKRKVFALAWPISLQQVAESWLFCVFGILSGRFGAVGASSHQVALTLAASAFMLALGISSASSVRVGHAVGAGNQKAIRQAALAGVLLVLAVMTTTATTFLAIPEFLVRLMTDQEAVITLATPLLSYAAAFALFDGIQAVMGGVLRGAGDIRVPFVIGICCYWGVGGTLGWFAMNSPMGVAGIWVGLCGGLMAASLCLSARFIWLVRNPIARVDTD